MLCHCAKVVPFSAVLAQNKHVCGQLFDRPANWQTCLCFFSTIYLQSTVYCHLQYNERNKCYLHLK